MIVVIGLGNIGKEYQNTRHNVGFITVNHLSDYYKLSWRTKDKFNADISEGLIGPYKLLLVKPLTYMNLSGKAVNLICSYYNIKNLSDIYIIHDDIDLSIGKIKYKLGGTHGGHNGLKSINQYLGNNNYSRIKIGIGRPINNIEVSNYVLNVFPQQEYEIILKSINNLIDNFSLILSNHIEEFKQKIR